MKVPSIITHRNLQPLLDALTHEPEFQIGSKTQYDPAKWYRQEVTLEVATGELAKDGLSTLALVGRSNYTPEPLSGREQFNAQGLEGKVSIRKELFAALMNLRDIVPPFRGRILLKKG